MKIISLFSGAGGLDLGFVQAGHVVIWANDIYLDAVETYRKNLGEPIISEDITKINTDDIPDGDIVIGGFPCQGFSVANMNRYIEDERNILYKQLIRVIKAKKPKYFLAENVKGIMSLGKGMVFEMILKDFSEMGYRVIYKLLNAANYGVPQKRERVIIVGVRNDIDFEYIYPQPTHSENVEVPNTKKWVSVKEALKDICDPDLPNDLYNHEYSKFKLKFNGYIGNRRLDPDKPATTVTGRGDDKGGVVVLIHPNNTRRMSCRELASIQSFPLDYEFMGSKSSIYRQIANAVPPGLAKAIASQFPKE